MKRILKWLLLAAAALILIGGIVFLIGFALAGFHWDAVAATKYEMLHFAEKTDNALSSIAIDYDSTDVVIVFDDAATFVSVEYPQKQTKKGENINVVTVTETEGCLSIVEKESAYAWDWLGETTPTLTVTLPAERTYTLALKVTYGDVSIQGKGSLQAVTMELKHGDINAQNAEMVCQGGLLFKMSYGDVALGKVQAEKVEIKCNHGDFEVENACLQTKELYVEMQYGDVEIDGLQAEKMTFKMSYGDVEAVLYGEKTEYTLQVQVEYGDSNVVNTLGGDKVLTVISKYGDIEIAFRK